jgi:hypothetical protein
MFRLTVHTLGSLRLEVSAVASSARLDMALLGATQAHPYAQAQGANPQLTYGVTADQVATARDWTVTLTNLRPLPVRGGQLTVTYPDGIRQTFTFDLPGRAAAGARASQTQDNPYQDIAAAGRVDVLIVPHGQANQPTPSLGLINRVSTYLQARSDATAQLWVTGPDWVMVTVDAALAPRSLDQADQVRLQAKTALNQFLHSLTGGPQGQGWPFGRHPQRSDLYALLESLPGVDHVTSLEIAIRPEIVADRRDRTLIYSGPHKITLV